MTPGGYRAVRRLRHGRSWYYAAEASEASHTVPPMASYYSGHQLNAAYYPHLVLGMIHRFAAVAGAADLLPLRVADVSGLTALTSSSRSSRGRIAHCRCRPRWRRSSARGRRLLRIWRPGICRTRTSTGTTSSGRRTSCRRRWMCMHFSTWGPSLPLFFTALYAIVRGLQTHRWGWIVLGAFVLIASCSSSSRSLHRADGARLAARGLLRRRLGRTRAVTRRRSLLGVLFSVPFLYGAAISSIRTIAGRVWCSIRSCCRSGC